MRAFAAAWPELEVVQRRAAQLPWRHHMVLLDKLRSTDERLWYAAEAFELGWSRAFRPPIRLQPYPAPLKSRP